MTPFGAIFDRAARRHGGADALGAILDESKPLSPSALEAIPDDRWLSAMTRRIFQAGFNWSVIDNKWDGFETAFDNFDIGRWVMASDEDLDSLAKDKRIVRNPQKIRTVRENAVMIDSLAKEHGSAGKAFGHWPSEDFAGLLELLKSKGSRLGGTTAQYFLRGMGVPSYVLSAHVVAALIEAGIIDKAPTSKKAMAAVQNAFNRWMAESGRSLTGISRTLALSTDG